MSTLDEISEALFSGSNPGGKFLLCLVVYIPLIMLKDHFKVKMNDIATKQDPTLLKDNPFTRVLLNNIEVWTNPEWRALRNKHSFVEYVSFIPLLFGMWFGFELIILILGTVLNW
jgi:hypothetical protein